MPGVISPKCLFCSIQDWPYLQKPVLAATSISDKTASVYVVFPTLLHRATLLFLIRCSLILINHIFPLLSTYVYIFRNGEGEINLTWKIFCYKICCEIEPFFVDGLSHLTQIEWLLCKKYAACKPTSNVVNLFFPDRSRTECQQFILGSHKNYRWGRLLDIGNLSADAACYQLWRK